MEEAESRLALLPSPCAPALEQKGEGGSSDGGSSSGGGGSSSSSSSSSSSGGGQAGEESGEGGEILYEYQGLDLSAFENEKNENENEDNHNDNDNANAGNHTLRPRESIFYKVRVTPEEGYVPPPELAGWSCLRPGALCHVSRLVYMMYINMLASVQCMIRWSIPIFFSLIEQLICCLRF